MDTSVTAAQLHKALESTAPPIVIDVRRTPAFSASTGMIQGALRRDPELVMQWAGTLPRAADVVVYCVHGHEVSQGVAATLGARFLEGGFEAWRAGEGALSGKPSAAPTRWVTRERPKIDRIACPWLVRRFIDADAEFLYVPAPEVQRVARERCAEPYDIPGVTFTHTGQHCSFDAFIDAYRLRDPAIAALATIVRGADTGALGLTPQSAGLVAVSLGLSRLFADDHEMLNYGMTLYDALYAWCREGMDEEHMWKPQAIR